jgi:hypothetical protein
MGFPTGADYMEALQHPAACFPGDPELAGGQVELTPLGLPRAISGNFASVFKVEGASGRLYAVRCFTRWFDDQAERYDAISYRLSQLKPRWAVPFDFVTDGVRVGGDRFPILKMPWADARPLLSYVEDHLWDGPALAYLAARFAALVDELSRAGVAHGDLQHGNILVAPGGDLRLVDFDGMYVPALRGRGSNELGHRNYQHPGRRRDEFGPDIDRFPSWVVYASLAAVSVDPVLWGRLDGGDECLLFREQDFAAPDRSEALAALEATGDRALVSMAATLRKALAGEAVDVPALSSAPELSAHLPAAASPASLAILAERKTLFAALKGEAPAAPREEERPAPSLDEVIPVEFGPAVAQHRRLLLSVAVAVMVFLGLAVSGAMPLFLGVLLAVIAAASSVGLARRQFHSMPEVQAVRPRQLELAELLRAAAARRAAVDDLARRRGAADGGEEEAARRHAEAEAELRRDEQVRLTAIDGELRAALSALTDRESELYRAEHRERDEALRAVQQEAIDKELGGVRLASARVPGVGDHLVYALALDDVRTAADFVDVVAGAGEAPALVLRGGRQVRSASLGPAEAGALLRWRRAAEERFRTELTAWVPPEQAAEIRERYEAQRRELEAEQERARAEAAQRADAARASFEGRRREMAAALQAAQQDAAALRLRLDQDLPRARKDAAEAEWRRAACQRDLAARAGLTFGNFLRRVLRVSST